MGSTTLGQSSTSPRAVGIPATLTKTPQGRTKPLRIVSSEKGILVFKNLPAGTYKLELTTGWGEKLRHDFVLGDHSHSSAFKEYPLKPLKYADVKITVDWPEDLKEKGLKVLCNFMPQVVSDWGRGKATLPYSVLMGSEGLVADHLRPDEITWINPHVKSPAMNLKHQFREIALENNLEQLDFSFGSHLPLYPEVQTVQRVATPGLHYLSSLDILLPDPEKEVLPDTSKIKLNRLASHNYQFHKSITPEYKGKINTLSSEHDHDDIYPEFSARLNEENIWTIELPESLVTQVREYLQDNNL